MILKLLIGGVIGGGLRFACGKFAGGSTGTRPHTSNPILSTICGAGLGALMATRFR